MELDTDLLERLEQSLDTTHPESGDIPIEVLGHGEISLVFRIIGDPAGDIAYKRLPIFESRGQVERHISSYNRYSQLLRGLGIRLPEHGAAWVRSGRKFTLFCAQRVIPPESVGNRLLHTMSDDEICGLVRRILGVYRSVWAHNLEGGDVQIGFDGQISNFAEVGGELYYLDTSTPMYRVNGEPAMDATLFLSSAPPGIRILLRVFFLREVVDRYYRMRDVIIDLVANFYKEQREDLVPRVLVVVNDFLREEVPEFGIGPVSEKEVRSYYREDKFIWALFLRVRKLHRFITTKILRRRYPFYLPGDIRR